MSAGNNLLLLPAIRPLSATNNPSLARAQVVGPSSYGLSPIELHRRAARAPGPDTGTSPVTPWQSEAPELPRT
jgi:hypothetical protein